MSAHELGKAIRDLEAAADLLTRAADTLATWDHGYDSIKEQAMARELHYRALALRLLLETEVRERVMH